MTELAREPETGTGRRRSDLSRRLVAEALGTDLLIIAVIGSGIMASRLSPDDVGLQLLENAAATAGALIGLILMFGAVSGAHFNPVVTLVDRATTRSPANVVAFAVGVWIGGAYWFTSSTSFANPAVTIARTLSDTFAGIAPSSAPMFIAMQLVGAAVAYALIQFLFQPAHDQPPT